MTVNAASPLPAGRFIHNGRYEIGSHLGNGTFGDVYRVFDHHQGRVVALKLLHGVPASEAWNESAILTAIRGDFIVPVLNADQAAGVPFIVTDVLEGGSVDARAVPDIGVEVDVAARWVHQACTGVSRIHDYGLLHNDIKPGNLFLDAKDNVLVGDLGLARLMDPQGHGPFAGTPTTLAPEVAASQLGPNAATVRPTSKASDVYSLGATLYELIAGHYINPSLSTTGPASLLQTIAAFQPPPLMEVAPHVPQGLSQVVMKAVAASPADRYPNPAEFGAAIAGRNRPSRQWSRVPPCSGHSMCFRSDKASAAPVFLCAVPVGSGTRHELRVLRGQNRRRDNPWPVVAQSQLARAIRSRIRAVG